MKTLKILLPLAAIAAALTGCSQSVPDNESMAPQLQFAMSQAKH